jgi:hypothetical protein
MVPFLGIAAGVVLVTGLAGFGSSSGSTQASQARPVPTGSSASVLVHIIFDEHIGVEGMLRDGADVLAMREELKSFYLRNGFRLFGGAYSQYLHTINSIPQILNLGVQQPRSAFSQRGSDLTINAYFDALGALEYRIHVSQTDFLNFCENASVVSCRTRRAADAHDLVDAAIPAGEKSRLLVNEMIKLSHLVTGAVASYDLIGFGARYLGLPVPLHRLNIHRMPTAIGALESMGRLTEELRHAQPGNAYFMHELLPHYPYVVDGECRLKETSQWYNRRAGDVVKERREAGYFDQLSCLLTKLDTLLQALATSPAGANAIVVLHGDHGSRITDIDARAETESSFDDSDLVTGYATHFAVRAPGIEPGYEPRRMPAAKLLEAIVRSDFHSTEVSLPPGFVHSVMLENSELEPVREHPLPAWWVGAE